MCALFEKTRNVLSTGISQSCSVQFPKEALGDMRLKDRCCFSAHHPSDLQCGNSSPAILEHPNAGSCLQHVFMLIKATASILWFLGSHHHDALRTCLGLRAPANSSIVQATFYSSQEGCNFKTLRSIAILVRKTSGHDEIWLVDDPAVMNMHGAKRVDPRDTVAFLHQGETGWSNKLYENLTLLELESCNMKVLGLTRARSKSFAVSGCRGVACVLAEPSFLTVYDLEDGDCQGDGGDDESQEP